ncbi:hypothetical protein AAG906_039664 [Vitis piasezkii]
MSIAQYYNTLICHWQQLDIFKEHDWNYPKDGIKYKKIIEQRRIFQVRGCRDRSLHPISGKISQKSAEESRKRGLNTIAMTIDKRKEDHGVITIADLDTPKKPATRFMVNQQIDENSTPFKPSLFSKEQLELLQKMFGQSQQAHVTSMIGIRSLAQKVLLNSYPRTQIISTIPTKVFGCSEKNLIPKQSSAYSLGTLQIKRGTSAIHQSQKDTITPWIPLNSYTDPSSQVPQTESLRAFVPTPSPQLEIPQAKPQNPLPVVRQMEVWTSSSLDLLLRFTKAIKRYEYSQGQTNHTLSIKHSPKGKIVILIVNVDGIIPLEDYEEGISQLKGFLAKEFKIKDLGNLTSSIWKLPDQEKVFLFLNESMS